MLQQYVAYSTKVAEKVGFASIVLPAPVRDPASRLPQGATVLYVSPEFPVEAPPLTDPAGHASQASQTISFGCMGHGIESLQSVDIALDDGDIKGERNFYAKLHLVENYLFQRDATSKAVIVFVSDPFVQHSAAQAAQP